MRMSICDCNLRDKNWAWILEISGSVLIGIGAMRQTAGKCSQMNFLVTGGAGFIGSHLCERLLRSGARRLGGGRFERVL